MNSSTAQRRNELSALESKRLLELSTIRSQLDELTPINLFLPNELLCLIFSLHNAEFYLNKRRPSAFAFTQVCRKWRMLSLRLSTLWSTIDLCNRPHASFCLSRVGENPDMLISVVAKTPSVQFEGSFEGMKDRIKSVDVMLFPNCMVKFFGSLVEVADLPGGHRTVREETQISAWNQVLQLRLENLTHLSLRIPSISEPVDLSFLNVGSVTNLVLAGVRVNWGSTGSKLKVLRLSRPFGPPCAPLLEDLLEIIERASGMLEEVVLGDFDSMFGVSAGGNFFSPAMKINTPLLRKLTVVSKDREFVDSIVSALSFGSDTQVTVRCNGKSMGLVKGVLVEVDNPPLRSLPSSDMLSVIGYLSDGYPLYSGGEL
ncbi:hypothetical protein L218DRAFT_1002212 [Marasmius fiardii PR-910]|nr:hypothetical protein L218DRAFT_1002212 [Marasmius fiardii PR-910]